MSNNVNPYQSPQQRPGEPPAESPGQATSSSDYLGGFRLALISGVVGGMVLGWIWMFLPSSSYDLLLGALATPPLFVLGLLFLLISDRRIVWRGVNAVRNLLLGAVLAIVAVALFFPVCTGTVIILEPVPDAALIYRSIGWLVFTATFAAALLVVARIAARRIQSNSYPKV